MKKVIRKNYSFIILFILGILVSTIIVKATTYINGNQVEYSGNKLTSDNVSAAIDELYTASRTKKTITAWEYHETGSKRCINGEEDTCVKTECYKNGSTCTQGTIIKYYVNDNLFHYFYVLRDNGTKITMQQRENTVRNIPWHAGSNDNSYGPDTVLPALENATSTWTNVNVLEYTPGETVLYENAYTGCIVNDNYNLTCNLNMYTMVKRTARARMITGQETSLVNCKKMNSSGSCPDFMHNYLYQSTTYGGSYNDDTLGDFGQYNEGYWTMSSDSNSNAAWLIARNGMIEKTSSGYYGIGGSARGARAVVEVTKSNL